MHENKSTNHVPGPADFAGTKQDKRTESPTTQDSTNSRNDIIVIYLKYPHETEL